MAKRSKATKKAQATYERTKLDAGEHVQVGIKLKSAEDVAMFEALRKRFPDLKDAGIVRLALRKLGAAKN
jgi:hypothetical protein